MIRLPPSIESWDQLITVILNQMSVDDFLIAQQLLRDHETEFARTWVAYARREMLLEIRQPEKN